MPFFFLIVASLPHKPHWRHIIFSCEKSIILSLFKLYSHFGWVGTGRAITCFMNIFPLPYITTFPDKPVRQNNLFLFPPSWSSFGRKRFPAAWQPVWVSVYPPRQEHLLASSVPLPLSVGWPVCLPVSADHHCALPMQEAACQSYLFYGTDDFDDPFDSLKFQCLELPVDWCSGIHPIPLKVGQHCLNEFTGRHASFHFVQMLFHIYGYTNGFCNFCLHNLESFCKCKGGPAQPFCTASILFSVDFSPTL